MAKKPKTEGYEWLEHSLVSFNGSGYADRTDAGSYLDSYRAYKLWKNLPEAVVLVDKFWQPALSLAAYLIETSDGPGRLPSQSNWRRFNQFRLR